MESACSLLSSVVGFVVFLFMHFTGKDPVPKERKETPTKFEITPNETDVERYKALFLR